MPEYYVGIDLGTTNTIVSVLRKGRTETLLVEGEPICPSVVHFSGKDGIIVGRNAKKLMLIEPECTVASVKRRMGELNYRYKQLGNEYSPAQVSSFILKTIKEEAEKELGSPIKKAVVTVPAYFNDDQRAQTKAAAEMAGFEVLRLLSEPTAAALAYGINQGKDQTIAVYDLGGGTFDISILEVKGNTFTVKAIGGDSRLGGDDFDRALAAYVLEEFGKSSGIDLRKESPSHGLIAARQKLKEECQKRKEELAVVEETTVVIPNFYKGRHLEVPVTREKFETLIADLVAKTVVGMKDTLKQARLDKGDIDRVLLVGGSTRIPYVREQVTRTIKEPYTADNVMEMVARGAAFLAAQYMAIHDKGDQMIREVVKVSSIDELRNSILDISAFRLGIATVGFVPSEEAHRFTKSNGVGMGMLRVSGVFSEIVRLGQRIPLSACKDDYSTVVENQQSVLVEVYRTSKQRKFEHESCSDEGMQFLGDFNLRGIPLAPAGEPKITVTMDIDEDGILKVRAEEKATRGFGEKTFQLSVEREIPKMDSIEDDF